MLALTPAQARALSELLRDLPNDADEVDIQDADRIGDGIAVCAWAEAETSSFGQMLIARHHVRADGAIRSDYITDTA